MIKGALKYTQQIESNVFHKWNTCFNEFECKKSNSSTAKICEETTTKLVEFNAQLGRRLLCIDDIKSVLTNKHKFRIIYTDSDTYLTDVHMFEPEEGESLFSFE
jgi:Holliday junction resolvase